MLKPETSNTCEEFQQPITAMETLRHVGIKSMAVLQRI